MFRKKLGKKKGGQEYEYNLNEALVIYLDEERKSADDVDTGVLDPLGIGMRSR